MAQPSGQEGGNLSVGGPGQQERRGTAAQRDQGGAINGPKPTVSSQSSGNGLAQEAEALKADLQANAWSLSHPGWPGQRDSGGASAGGIAASPGGGRERVGRGWELGGVL